MDLNERINSPVIRHGLLMAKKAAGKDDISNIVHDRKLLILFIVQRNPKSRFIQKPPSPPIIQRSKTFTNRQIKSMTPTMAGMEMPPPATIEGILRSTSQGAKMRSNSSERTIGSGSGNGGRQITKNKNVSWDTQLAYV